ncbi:MAG TPA: response regulator [Actinomycetota bacterium]|nr:response regulator [Actinomycetota bacterium]
MGPNGGGDIHGAEAAATGLEPSDASALKVLVGDNDEATLNLLVDMLEVSGCEVLTARSGLDVIAEAINFGPHLIILEGKLPGMDGWSVCSVLSDVLEDTPLVFLSTQCQGDDFVRAKEHGASCCIRKPFGMGDLMKIVEPLSADLDRANRQSLLRGLDAD